MIQASTPTSGAGALSQALSFTALLLVGVCAACGDDDSSSHGTGCITDVECKGDRICVNHECVDPSVDSGVTHSDGGSHAGSGGASGGSGSSGSSGSSAAGRGGAGGAIDDPELEKACGRNCEARQDAACGMNTGTLDQCLAQCLVIDEANFGYCLKEQTAQYACLASGGYSCVSGYAQPKSTCTSETQALSLCGQKIPCWRFCAKAAGQCAPEGDECLTTCMAEQSGYKDAICGVYYSQLLSCWGQSLTCDGDRPAIGQCGASVAAVADCIGRRNHACDGYCWAAERMGCGSDSCLASCHEKADDSTCGRYYINLIECGYESRELNLECKDGEAVSKSAACSTQEKQYTDCTATSAP